MYYTATYGASWSAASGAVNSYAVDYGITCDTTGQYVYITMASGTYKEFMFSSNFGTSFSYTGATLSKSLTSVISIMFLIIIVAFYSRLLRIRLCDHIEWSLALYRSL